MGQPEHVCDNLCLPDGYTRYDWTVEEYADTFLLQEDMGNKCKVPGIDTPPEKATSIEPLPATFSYKSAFFLTGS